MAGRLVSPYGLLRDPRKGCGSFSLFAKIPGYDSAKGFQYGLPRTDGLWEQKKKFDFGEFLGAIIFGGVVGGFTSAGFYGAGKGIEKLKDGFRVGKSGSKTNFDNEIPRSGSEWNEYLKGKYGADNVHWNINSVDDIFSDPTRLKGYTADELQKVLGNDWIRGVYGSNGGGWKLMNGDISIFYHPGGGKHGGSYYGISSGATGKIKVVNPETYIPLKGDKATIIYD